MRDFHDAKAMAQSLREAMSAKQIELAHSESLEITSRMLGFADWNTLSARINADRSMNAPAKASGRSEAVMPVLPIKDLVPFPTMQVPLWIKRPKTVEALSQAFSTRREIVLVAQRRTDVEEPGSTDVHDVGIVARVLDVGPPSPEAVAQSPRLDGSIQVLLQGQRRVAIRNFSGRAGRYEAEVDPIDEGMMTPSPELVEHAAERFESYAAANAIPVPQMWPPLRRLHDPGRVADIIAQHLPTAVEDKQAVLAMRDPVARLELVLAQME